MVRGYVFCLSLLTLVLGSQRAVAEQEPQPPPAQVSDQAIQRGLQWLRKQQARDPVIERALRWLRKQQEPKQMTMNTVLGVLALEAAGAVPTTHPAVQNAIQWLSNRQAREQATTKTALGVLGLKTAGAVPATHPAVEKAVRWLRER